MAHQKINLDRSTCKRWPERDFSDDGTRFAMYKYKNALPISRASGTEDLYLSIRLDYLGIPYQEYCDDFNVLNFYNRVPRESFDARKFNDLCEYIYEKYLNGNQNIEKPI